MALCTADFELGSNGSSVLAADAGSSTAWNSVDVPGGTIVYDNAHSYGALAAKFDHTAGGASECTVSWTTALGSPTEHYGRVFMYHTVLPGSGARTWIAETGSLKFIIGIDGADGTIDLVDSVGALGSSVNAIALNRWIRIEWHVIHHASTGLIELKLFNDAESNSPTEIVTLSNCNTGSSAAGIYMGAASGGSNHAAAFWLDRIVAGATSWPSSPTPAVSRRSKFDYGTAGNTIATSDPGSPDVFSDVSTNADALFTYSNTQKYGLLSGRLVLSATPGEGGWTWTGLGSPTEYWGRLYMHHSALPSNLSNVLRVFGEPSDTFMGDLRITSSGFLRIAFGSTWTGTVAMATGQWVRVEWHIVHSTTIGFIEFKLFNSADSITPSDSISTAGAINTLASASIWRFGDQLSLNASRTIYYDNVAVGTTGYLGPFVDDVPLANTAAALSGWGW